MSPAAPRFLRRPCPSRPGRTVRPGRRTSSWRNSATTAARCCIRPISAAAPRTRRAASSSTARATSMSRATPTRTTFPRSMAMTPRSPAARMPTWSSSTRQAPPSSTVDAQVDFLARGSGYSVFLSDGDAVLALQDGDSGHAVRLDLVGGDSNAAVTGEDLLGSYSNYLIGSDSDGLAEQRRKSRGRRLHRRLQRHRRALLRQPAPVRVRLHRRRRCRCQPDTTCIRRRRIDQPCRQRRSPA